MLSLQLKSLEATNPNRDAINVSTNLKLTFIRVRVYAGFGLSNLPRAILGTIF